MTAPSPAAFTEARARDVLAAAGRPDAAAGAELLSLGENAVFALGANGPVVRIGRSAELLERAERELAVARWLAAEGVPAVRAAEPVATLVDGHPVTYWQRLPAAERPASPEDLATLLKLVHALPEPPFALPRRELLGGVERWLRLAGDAVSAADADYLRGRRDAFAAAASALEPRLPRGPLHGDALPRNVHIGPDGPVLVDLETFSSDLREHDLVVMALSRDRYGLSPEAYDSFVSAYGWDVRDWEGCAVLRGARETASCAWVSQHAPGNPAARTEFGRRIASLREKDATVRWYPF
ncbi:aminoglycoside phosphotransferase family protein [Streptomyces kronopolitis]|uniref:aminoglycoside phosphotransferase family protein n=1 Tax=Streptomyces TaxID=1883 RepID=UPI0020C107BF|nr:MULTISPECIES: aminoglycoside phosphotransferase family protein [Streptomyces]MCL6299150.1 aminoglycoside phosphotransferase family protein [Streptomyces kronopolitis]GLW17918.1 aminoglycoside phosphotransferase [Streptomyces sp. NBRC 13847]